MGSRRRYEGLNLYESDLLDYLKTTFDDSEFKIRDIQFPEKMARGHRYMFQHLYYLIALHYLEPIILIDGRYFYKINRTKA